jgi:hypothetical protein
MEMLSVIKLFAGVFHVGGLRILKPVVLAEVYSGRISIDNVAFYFSTYL